MFSFSYICNVRFAVPTRFFVSITAPTLDHAAFFSSSCFRFLLPAPESTFFSIFYLLPFSAPCLKHVLYSRTLNRNCIPFSSSLSVSPPLTSPSSDLFLSDSAQCNSISHRRIDSIVFDSSTVHDCQSSRHTLRPFSSSLTDYPLKSCRLLPELNLKAGLV